MRRSATLCALACLAACAPEDAADPVVAEPVVVFAGQETGADWPDFFEAFTQQTGTIVIVRTGSSPGLADDVIDNTITPPADVLIASTANEAIRVADDGALRPLPLDLDAAGVAYRFRDPDGYWVGIATRSTAIAVSRGMQDAAVGRVSSLAGSQFEGRLCLSTSRLPSNLNAVAAMIDNLGVGDAELTVRGWVANLAQPVFADEAALLAALAGGDCGAGIVTSRAFEAMRAANPDLADTVRLLPGIDTPIDVDAAGIARHARNPAGAAQLLAWLLRADVQARYARQTAQHPTVPAIVADGTAGPAPPGMAPFRWLEDARALVERARYP